MTPGTLAGFDSNSDDVTKDDEVYPNLRGRHLRMTPEALLAEWPVLHEQRHEDAGRVIRHRLLRSRPGLGVGSTLLDVSMARTSKVWRPGCKAGMRQWTRARAEPLIIQPTLESCPRWCVGDTEVFSYSPGAVARD